MRPPSPLLSALLLGLLSCAAMARAGEPTGTPPVTIRVAAWNVVFGSMATPEQVGRALLAFEPDVVGLNEVPAGDWSARVGKVLGLEHVHVGEHSPLGYRDKYKSIISRAPLENPHEHHLGQGWSAVTARTTIRGVPLSVYSLHVGGRREGHQRRLAREILPKDDCPNVIMMGDFNSVVGQDRRKRDREGMSWLLEAGMRPTWKDLGIDVDRQFTHDPRDPASLELYGVIDHVLVGPRSRLEAVDGGIIELDPPLSDHKPVWAALRVAGD